jgi:uncharacterized protein, PH0010 family
MRIIPAIFILCIVIFASIYSCAADVKEPDLAGSWYSASKSQLEAELKSYLDAANPEVIDEPVLAIIVPHAGYVYSGPVAAYGYKAIEGKGIKTVIVLGFSHRKYLDGISIYGGTSWKTPLGEIAVDTELAQKMISANPRFKFQKELFDDENSVEMQIPFIQMALGKMGQSPSGTVPIFPKIVPIAFGGQNYSDAQALAQVLAGIVKDRSDILLVASTDLSHFHPYEKANSIDDHTIKLIDKINAKELFEEAKMGVSELCGLMPVAATLMVAEMTGCDKIKTLKYANSGDTTSDKSRVVGYVSAVVYKNSSQLSVVSSQKKKEESRMLNDSQRKRLLSIARESITSYVRDGKRKEFAEKDPLLNEPLGAFVTLHEAGDLRGCIGNMVGQGPLYKTIASMAIESATGDPRFNRLSPAEIEKIKIEISVLSPLKKVNSADEIEIPGHGVIVKSGFNSGVYLPQVAIETGWSKEEFLSSLCAQKAGLKPDAWKDPATELYTFTAEVFGEEEK